MFCSISILAALPIFLSVITAAPLSVNDILDIIESPQTLGGSTFKISQIQNTGYVASGPVALAKAYSKYNTSLSSDISSALSSLTTGASTTASTSGDTVTATPLSYDSEYLCQVQIGTPPQTLSLDFDTGSSDLWVFSNETPTSEVNGQTLYNPYVSSSARNLTLTNGATWSISYADGSGSSGDVLLDTVSIGDVSVKNQAVESAKQVSSSFTATSQSSGLLGLAFDSINRVTPQQKTFFTNAKSSLASPLFTANLKKGAAGSYNFGFINSTEHTGAISYTAVNSASGFWGFTASGFSVGSTAFNSTAISAIADTGTTLLLLPDSIVSTYYSHVSGASYSSSAGGYVFSCTTTLPDFTFGLDSGYRGTVPGSYINYAPSGVQGQCYGGIQSSSSVGFAIFGDIVLKAQFVVFDVGNTRLGFASKNL